MFPAPITAILIAPLGVAALMLSIPMSPISDPERLDDELCSGAARILLLPGNEEPVADGEWLEPTVDDKVRPRELAGFLLDPERLGPLPEGLVCEVLLAVGEPGPGLAGHEQRAIRERRLEQKARGMAEDPGHLARRLEAAHKHVHARLVDEGDHRCLAADEEDRVAGGRAEVAERPAR